MLYETGLWFRPSTVNFLLLVDLSSSWFYFQQCDLAPEQIQINTRIEAVYVVNLK